LRKLLALFFVDHSILLACTAPEDEMCWLTRFDVTQNAFAHLFRFNLVNDSQRESARARRNPNIEKPSVHIYLPFKRRDQHSFVTSLPI
jgi:hypothetical protein